MADKRDKLIKSFVKKNAGDAFGRLGGSPGDRIKRGRHTGKPAEDDPGWDAKTMGNKRGRSKGFVRQY